MVFSDINTLQSLVATSPSGIAVIDADTLLIEMVNDAFLLVTGKTYSSTYGTHVWEAFSEAAAVYQPKMEEVIREAKAIKGDEVEIMLVRNGREEMLFISFMYTPLTNSEGKVTKVAVWVLENTSGVKERQNLQRLNEELSASNEEIRATTEELSALNEKLIVTENELQEANEALEKRVAERTRQLAGSNKELIATNSDLLIAQRELEQVNDKLEERVADRTRLLTQSEVQLQQMVAELQASELVKGIAIELSQLGTWLIDADPQNFIPSPRLKEIFGYGADETMSYEAAVSQIPNGHRQRVLDAVKDAVEKGADYEIEYPVVRRNDEEMRYIKAIGKTCDIGEKKNQFIGMLADITEQKDAIETEQALNEELTAINEELSATNEELLQAQDNYIRAHNQSEKDRNDLLFTIEAASLATFDLNPATGYLSSNALLKSWFGLGAEEEIELGSAIDSIAEPDRPRVVKAIEEALQFDSGGKYDIEYTIINPHDGVKRMVRAKGKTLFANNGEAIRLSGVLQDITEQKQLLLDLAESEARFRVMAEGSEVMISVNDMEGNVEYVNQAWLTLTGRSQAQMKAYGWGDFLHPDDRESLLQQFREGIASKAPFTLEFRMMKKNNEPRWIYTKINPRLSPDGSYTGTISSSIDMTERRKYQRELEEINQRLNIALDAGSFGSTEVEFATGKMICNEQFKKCFGRTKDEELTYPQMFEAMLPQYREEVRRRVLVARANHAIYEAEYEVRWPDGSLHWISAHGRARYNSEGEAVKIVGIISDITESKRDEQRKNDFIGMVSHELKTPLTSLSGIVQIAGMKLKEGPDQFLSTAMDKANMQVKRMSDMINGFLNVSRLESGKLQIEKQSFNLDELIRESVKESELTITTHIIHTNICDGLHVVADRDKIGSVVTNLISNAVKYSPKGKNIYVTCEAIGDIAKVSVKDEGMGIQAADKEKIFDRYYRVEGNSTKNISGFGIGLYLSAEIIYRHDGKIGVESEPGQGSTFWFALAL